MTIAGQSFSSIGMTAGNYVWTGLNDTITLNIAALPTAAIPLPAGRSLLVGALGLRHFWVFWG